MAGEILTLAELEDLAPLGIEDEPHAVQQFHADPDKICDIYVQTVMLDIDMTGHKPPQVKTEEGHCTERATHVIISHCTREMEAIAAGASIPEHVNYTCAKHAGEAQAEIPGTHRCPQGHAIHIIRVVPITPN